MLFGEQQGAVAFLERRRAARGHRVEPHASGADGVGGDGVGADDQPEHPLQGERHGLAYLLFLNQERRQAGHRAAKQVWAVGILAVDRTGLTIAADEAYKMAGVSPSDVDFAEIYERAGRAGFVDIEYNPMTLFNNNSFLRAYRR